MVLPASVFVVAASGLVYELVAGAVSSYLLGDAVTQFSLVIGVFLSSMGVGSYLARFVRRNLLRTFVELEIWIGLVGGASSVILFAVSAVAAPLFPVFFYSLCVALGVMVGLEIPLLIRLLQRRGGWTAALSDVLALDYLGALAGAVLFPLVVLPYLGLSRASMVFGVLNLAVAAVGWRLVEGRRRLMGLRLAMAMAVLVGLFFGSGRIVGFFEDLLYQDDVILARSTPYQRLVLTRWRGDIRLYINGNIQFSSIDEARYHESLVIPAMEAHPHPRDVLILGGGDGLAAREVLKYPTVEQVVLVDLDPAMTRLGLQRPEIVQLNERSLHDPRVEIVNADAMTWVVDNRDFWDVILVDLPDPNSDSLARLYSRSFYTLLARRLSSRGLVVTQATSPFFATRAFRCIEATMASVALGEGEGPVLHVLPYHVHVPSFGEWGFVMGSLAPVDPDRLAPSRPTRFHTAQTLSDMFDFGKDLRLEEPAVVNRLDHPVLFTLYRQGWARFNR